jgi:hypothetical protein
MHLLPSVLQTLPILEPRRETPGVVRDSGRALHVPFPIRGLSLDCGRPDYDLACWLKLSVGGLIGALVGMFPEYEAKRYEAESKR